MGKFCTNCGTKLEDNANHCTYCGKAVKENKKEEVVAEKVEETKTTTETTNNTQTQKQTVPGAKNKIVAGLLGVFFGGFGVHNFYLGYTGKAVAQLLITILSCCVFSWISYLWGFIEGIMILTGSITKDAKGNDLVE